MRLGPADPGEASGPDEGAQLDSGRGVSVAARPWAAGVYLAFSALVGLAWAAPLAAAAGAVVGAYPRGDGELFDPGGVMLLETLRHLRSSAAAIGAAWTVLAAASLPLGVVVLAFCLAQLGARAPERPSSSLARAVRALPSLAAAGVVALIAEAVLIALIMVIGGAFVRSVWPAQPAYDVARWALIGCALGAALIASVLHDLVRVSVVVRSAGTYAALVAAFVIARRSPARVAWSFTWRSVIGAGAACGAAWLGVHIGASAPGAVLAMALVHQLGLAAMGWMRLSWLARAIQLAGERGEARPRGTDGESSRAVPPTDPPPPAG